MKMTKQKWSIVAQLAIVAVIVGGTAYGLIPAQVHKQDLVEAKQAREFASEEAKWRAQAHSEITAADRRQYAADTAVSDIYQHVFNDEIRKLNMVELNPTASMAQVCAQRMLVAQAHLQAGDRAGFNEANKKANSSSCN